jgi:hypothetical protein
MAMSNAQRKNVPRLSRVIRLRLPEDEGPLHKAICNGDLGVAKVQHIEPHMHTKLNNLRTCVCLTEVFRKHDRDFLCKVICIKEHTQTILIPSLFEFV